MRLRSSLAMIALCASGSLHAQSRAARPAAVEAEINAARGICRELGGIARFAPGGGTGDPAFETRVDLNGDRVDDYILDYTGLSCDSHGGDFINPGMCGSAGCPLGIFISGPGGHRGTPMGNVQGWEINRSASPPTLRLALHGSSCGRVGSDTCYVNWGWNGRVFAEVPETKPATQPALAPAPSGRSWTQSTGANGSRMASIRDLPPPATGIALTCRGALPILAMNLGRQPGRTINVGFVTPSGRAEITVAPFNNEGGWAAPLRDTGVLDVLSGADAEAQVTIGGRPAGKIPLTGSSRAIGEALSGCYRMTAAAPPAGAGVASAPGSAARPAATGSTTEAEAFVDKAYRMVATDSHAPATIYTSDLAALEARWFKALDAAGQRGEEVGEPMDPMCQDPVCGGIRLVSRSVRMLPDGRAEALVRYDFPGSQPNPVGSQKLILERTAAGWRIADIVSDGSYAAFLRQDIAQMEARPRRR